MEFVFLFSLILMTNFSSVDPLDETEITEVGNKIKTIKYCKNYPNAVCCAEDAGMFASGFIYKPETRIQQRYSSDSTPFPKVAKFQGFDIQSIRELTPLLQNKDIEVLKIIGSSRLTIIGQSAFSNFRSLHTLDLSHNSLTFESSSEMYAFFNTFLIELDLSHNKIGTTDILMKALKQLNGLHSLYLNNNRNLTIGPEGFPASLGTLEFLDLSYCHIIELDDNAFSHLHNLKNLHLEGNVITTIPKSLCDRPPTLQLHLANTHINKKYQKYLQEKCSVKVTFESSMLADKNFQIVDDGWHFCVWFFLWCLFAVIIVGLVIYVVYITRKKVFMQLLHCDE